MVYVFMPIIQKELEVVRRDYNAYPMRKNKLSNLLCGAPEDNYTLLANNATDMAVHIERARIEEVRALRLSEFDATMFIEPQTTAMLDTLMQDSPEGVEIDVGNGVQQYLYLRERLQTLVGGI